MQRAGPSEFERNGTFHRPLRVRGAAKHSSQGDEVLRALRISGDIQPVAPVARRIAGADRAERTCDLQRTNGSGLRRVSRSRSYPRQAYRNRTENKDSPFETCLDAPDTQGSRQCRQAHDGAVAGGVGRPRRGGQPPERRRGLRRPRPTNHPRCPAGRLAAKPTNRQARCARKRVPRSDRSWRPVERPGCVQPRSRRFHDAARDFQARFAWPPIGRQDCVDRRIQRLSPRSQRCTPERRSVPCRFHWLLVFPGTFTIEVGAMERGAMEEVAIERAAIEGTPGGLAMVAESWAESAPRTPWSVPSARRNASASEASSQVSARSPDAIARKCPPQCLARRSVPRFAARWEHALGSLRDRCSSGRNCLVRDRRSH